MNVLLLAQAVTDTNTWSAVTYLIYSAAGVALIGLMSVAGVYLARRAAESKKYMVLSKAWVVLQAVVGHVEAKIRPTVQLALADGKLTKEERVAIQTEALKLAREALANQLEEIKRVFGLTGDGALDVFLGGLLEQAYAALMDANDNREVKVSPGAPTPTPTSGVYGSSGMIPRP